MNSLRRFGASVSRAAGGAAGELAAAGAGWRAVVRAGRAVGYVGRHGVLGTAGSGRPSGSGGSCAARSGARGSLARRRRRRPHGESRNRQLAGRPARRHRHRRAGERAELREPASGTVAARTGAARDRHVLPRVLRAVASTAGTPRGQQATRRTATVGDRPGRSPGDATGRRAIAHRTRATNRAARLRSPPRRRAKSTPPPRGGNRPGSGEAMTPTLRRLNDRERYYGLTWPGWVALAAAGGVLYGAVRVSPFGLRATVTIVVLVLAFLASIALALQGQTIGPGRYLLALYRYRRAAKQLAPPTRADKHGLVLDVAPERGGRARARSRRSRWHDRLARRPAPASRCSSPTG